jgi:hypothetical protein
MAPPQKKLKGVTVILLLSLKGAGFDPMRVDSGAWVLVNPNVAIAEIGGTQILELSSGGGGGFDRLFASSGGIYLPSL